MDPTNSLARGMVLCVLPGLTYGFNLAPTTFGVGALLADSSPAPFAETLEGPGLLFNGTNTTLKTTNLATSGQIFPATASTPISVYFRGYQTAAPSSFAPYASATYDNAGTSPFFEWCLRSTATVYQVFWFPSGGGTSVNAAATPPSSGLVSICSTLVPNGNVNFFVNGAQDANFPTAFTSAAWGTPASTGRFVMGTDLANAGRFINNSSLLCCVWNRLLSNQEVLSLHLDPYQFLTSADIVQPFLTFIPPPPPPPVVTGWAWQEY